MRILRALAKEGLAPRHSRGKLANKGWCGQPCHTATRPAVRGLPAPRGRPYAASSGGEVSLQTGFALSSDSAVDPEWGYLEFRRCEMRQHRRIAAESAHRFRRDQDLVIVRGAETPNGRAVKDHPLRAERTGSAAGPASENTCISERVGDCGSRLLGKYPAMATVARSPAFPKTIEKWEARRSARGRTSLVRRWVRGGE